MSQSQRSVPGPGQESVWDYPRPPRVEESVQQITIVFNGVTIADTRRARRVLETSHPPVYYLPPEDVRRQYLTATTRRTVCEYKGQAHYYTVTVEARSVRDAVWSYPHPALGYESLADYLAFYPGRMEACYVDGERVQSQEGDFYGGWITSAIVGPFKGGPGTIGW